MVFYELYIEKFAGTFQGLTAKLTYLRELGVNAIHILPFYPSPMVDDGYDVTDYISVRPELGTIDHFKILVNEAEKLEIKIVVDLVLNHTSTLHPWFLDAVSNPNGEKHDYYIWSNTGTELKKAQNPFHEFKDRNWIFEDQTETYYYSTFYPEQADLNWDNPNVLKEMLAVVDFWVSLGVAGFRLDAASHLIKREDSLSVGLPETHEIIKKIRKHLDEKYSEKRIILIAESSEQEGDAARKYFGDGDECHLVYHMTLASRLLLAFVRGDDSMINEQLNTDANLPKYCRWLNYVSNHDEILLTDLNDDERREILDFLKPPKDLLFKKDRSIASRLAPLLYGDASKILRIYDALKRTDGDTLIYYGEEIGMGNDFSVEHPRDIRRYLRGTFPWEEANRKINNSESLYHQLSKLLKA